MTTKRYRRIILEEEHVSSGILDGSRCGKCDEELYTNAKFCHSCGAQSQKSCDECGVIMPGAAGFCMNCGKQLFSREEELFQRIEQLRLKGVEQEKMLEVAHRKISEWERLIPFSEVEKAKEKEKEYVKMSRELRDIRKRFNVIDADITGDAKQLLSALLKTREKLIDGKRAFSTLSGPDYSVAWYGDVDDDDKRSKTNEKWSEFQCEIRRGLGQSAVRFKEAWENLEERSYIDLTRRTDYGNHYCKVLVLKNKADKFAILHLKEL